MKICAVCGFGVGSSMILRMSIEEALSNLGVEAEVEHTDLISIRGYVCDAIFTSHELASEIRETVNVPVYEVKRYMDVAEVTEQVKKFLGERK